mgnify:CR=1 FL=1
MRKNKIPIGKVQEAFNAAIKRRDGRCMIKDCEPCGGGLECSHFYTMGRTPSLRFYPPNAYAQCQRHHWKHHHSLEWAKAWNKFSFYAKWMDENHWAECADMEALRHCYINYDDELKAEIIRLCNADRLDELKELIEENCKEGL